MKKIALLFITALGIAFLVSCSEEKTALEPILPTDVMPEQVCESILGGKYDLSLENGGIKKHSENEYEALYLPSTLGETDPVKVTVISPSENLSSNDIKDMYKDFYKERTDKKKIEGLGNGAFLAFPFIAVYDNGYMIKIEAGSGNTDEQTELLLNLGKTAVSNLENKLNGEEKE